MCSALLCPSVHSQLAFLWYSLNPLFCEQARLCVSLSQESSLCFVFFFFSLAIPLFGLLSHGSSLRLSSGHSGPVLTLSMQPTPPCPAPPRWWWTQTSGPLLCWQLQLGTYSAGFFFYLFIIIIIFFFCQLCCPLRFHNSPQAHR